MTLFKTTPEQQLRVARYAVEMAGAGLPDRFVAAVMSLAQHDQGVFELMELWAEAGDDADEKDQIVADLQEVIDDRSDAPKEPTEKPKLHFDELEKLARDVLAFKTRLRTIIDQHGGVSEVARRSGIPQPSLSRLLTSASMPRRTTLYRIARALDLSESEIVAEWVR